MRLPTGDDSFFPVYFATERGKRVPIPPISIKKDHQIRQILSESLDRSAGLSMVLSGPDMYKVLALALTNASDEVVEVASLIFEKTSHELSSLTLAEMVEVIVSCVYEPTSDDDLDRVKSGDVWTFARIVDFFAHEYKWSIPTVMDLSRHQLKTMLDAVTERNEELEAMMKKGSSGSSSRGSSGHSNEFVRKVGGKPGKRKPMKIGADGKPEPDWSQSQGINSLLMFAQTKGVPIKQERDV